jgi:hypothetical protein
MCGAAHENACVVHLTRLYEGTPYEILFMVSLIRLCIMCRARLCVQVLCVLSDCTCDIAYHTHGASYQTICMVPCVLRGCMYGISCQTARVI